MGPGTDGQVSGAGSAKEDADSRRDLGQRFACIREAVLRRNGWLVHEQGIKPHIPVFDKSGRTDGTFSRKDFTWDRQNDVYRCPADKVLTTSGTIVNDNQLPYRASKYDCEVCELKTRCCPEEQARKVPRSIHEGARGMARDIAKTDA
ncbi:hypothetical protein ACVJBD_002227 [Rhizobium mongolense]